MPYTNKTARYDQGFDDDTGPVAAWHVLAVLAMVPMIWFLDATYNQSQLADGFLTTIGL